MKVTGFSLRRVAAYCCVPLLLAPVLLAQVLSPSGFYGIGVPGPDLGILRISMAACVAGAVAAIYAVRNWKELGLIEKVFAGVGYLLVMTAGVMGLIAVIGKWG